MVLVHVHLQSPSVYSRALLYAPVCLLDALESFSCIMEA